MIGYNFWPGPMHFCWVSLYGWMMSLVLADAALADAYQFARGLDVVVLGSE